MVELNVNTIVTKLNQIFENQRLVFWYDNNAELVDSIDEIGSALQAEIISMQPNQQFKTKTFLEGHLKDKYLIYAPFTRPTIENNFLTDVEEYSYIFTADIHHLLLKELGLPSNQLIFVKDHFKFFANKRRVAQFKKHLNETVLNFPELGIMAVILKVDQVQMSNFLKRLFEGGLEDNAYLIDFAKYNVLDTFWKLVEQEFGYLPLNEDIPTLICTLYINYTYSKMELDLPDELSSYQTNRLTNVIAFMSGYADSNESRHIFNKLSKFVWQKLNLGKFLQKVSMEDILKVNLYEELDVLILQWLKDRILSSDFTAMVGDQNLLSICEFRQKMTRYEQFYPQYQLLQFALKILCQSFVSQSTIAENIQQYMAQDYLMDSWYRQFIVNYQHINDPTNYKNIKDQVTNYYLNDYLNQIIKNWNSNFIDSQLPSKHQQVNFYHNYVRLQSDRIVVIISDAMRFEIAKELQELLDQDDRIHTQMDYLISCLPSVTYLGMPALLPHQKLELNADLQLLVDDHLADTKVKRAQILQNYQSNSAVFELDELLNCTSAELKANFVGKKVIYIYHNEIDAVGDNPKTENEVFNAATTAIKEIKNLVQALRTISVRHILVTADHGFIYRDRLISESDKINLDLQQPIVKKARYAIAKESIQEMGVQKLPLGTTLNNEDQRWVYYPKSANVFKVVGAKNYVHGGSSIQEMLVPILDIKMSSNRSQAQYVQLKLGNVNHRLTELDLTLPFIQTAPISDTVLACKFKIYFTDEKQQIISSEESIQADSAAADVESRIYRQKISLKNQKYQRDRDYHLVIENLTTGTKYFESFQIDVIIAGDFGFDF
ncbi:BREX-1 system phosphatase PglZ type A [Bombilactobacillus bombi]|uniref:BREX-1 system phosphatase PglZ type A n=1 Tax=Bombilactobacillus bombi TaxID=1303590 RepID=UPI0015E5E194|nr:BREX-1 system phosphatase PglZ type A [Bombilactobacillus bombi]MBA1434653.1 BREX-1 system phosphatase PglZ type A [Bombilactobacillus bombi]